MDFLFSGDQNTVQGTKQFNLIFFFCPVYLGSKYFALVAWEHYYGRVNIYVPDYESKPARSACRADGADPGRVRGEEASKQLADGTGR